VTQAPDLRKWTAVALAAALVIVLIMPVYMLQESRRRAAREEVAAEAPAFVGGEKCAGCHAEAAAAWRGSDHDRAMDVAADSTVLGDFDDAAFTDREITSRFYQRDGRFFVHTEGPDGEPGEFEITHVFGFDPLQQYLVPFPGGRLQALSIAWDARRGEWFHLYPDQDIPAGDWLHWTRNAQNWNGMCAECHSTNLVKNYDPENQTYATSWSEIDVSCEACHGPGSRHVAWAETPPMARPAVEHYALVLPTSGISGREQVALCAPCHSRRSELGDYEHTQPGLMDNVVPSLLDAGLYHADGQILDEVYVYGSFVQSKMYKNDVRCTNCHEAHSLKLIREGNDLCLQCHQAEVYDRYDHHFHKREHEGRPSDGHLCVKCHMPERPYMVIDWRADHSFRAPRPDLSLEIGTPNACAQEGCHADQSAEWAAAHYRDWYGRARKPHYGTVLAAARAEAPEARAPLIRLAGDPLAPAIVRATALSLLGAYPGDTTTAAFNAALSDEEAIVRHAAVMHVAGAGAVRLVELAVPLLFDPVRAVRMQAAVQLAGLPDTLFQPYQLEARAGGLAEYESAMRSALDFPFAAHNLGNLYGRLDRPDEAIAYYRTALEIDDLFYPAKVNLAMLENARGRNDEAARLLREVLEAYPDQHQTAYSLGLLLAEMNRYEEAADYLERAARGMPEHARAHYNLGLLRQELGRLDDAESALRRAVEIEPLNLDLLYGLAHHYLQRGQARRAAPIAERMLQLRPDEESLRQFKAYVDRAVEEEAPRGP
jgi:predicted CXXCH cytochrome family protein